MLRIEGTEDLVELNGVGDLGRRDAAALGHRFRLLGARRQLDVGLAEKGLLAQDGLRVAEGIGA